MSFMNKLRAAVGVLRGSTGHYYTGASHKKSLRGWSPSDYDPSREALDLPELRKRSRDLFRNNTIGSGAIRTMATNVIGGGLSLQSRIDRKYLGMSDAEADEWEEIAQREFNFWARSADVSGELSFNEIQEIAFQNFLLSGEVFVLLPVGKPDPYSLRLNLVAAEQIRDDFGLDGGIKYDRNGRPISYRIEVDPMSSRYVDVRKYSPSGLLNVIHIYKRDTPSQRRGTPFLAPVIDSIKSLGRYTDAFLQKEIIKTMYAVFIRSEFGDTPASNIQTTRQTLTSAEQESQYELSSGAVIALKAGEDISTANPQGSDPNYDNFYNSVVRQIGMSLEIPFEVLQKSFTASYSASRASMLEFWRTVRTRRAWFSNKFCQPVYEQFLSEAVLRGRVKATDWGDPFRRSAYCRAVWNGASQGQIDPVKETRAFNMQVEAGFITNTAAAAALNGSDWENNVNLLKKEKELYDPTVQKNTGA